MPSEHDIARVPAQPLVFLLNSSSAQGHAGESKKVQFGNAPKDGREASTPSTASLVFLLNSSFLSSAGLARIKLGFVD